MMNDIYLEYILKKKKTGGQKAIIAVIIFAAIIVSLALLLLIFATATALSGTQFGSFSFSIGLVLIAFAWYGAYLLMSMQNIEYEYILTNSEIDIDKIMSKKARKRIASFDFKEINICANINDNEHNHDYKNVTVSKTFDVTGEISPRTTPAINANAALVSPRMTPAITGVHGSRHRTTLQVRDT